jgi:dihydropteroate synthase
VAEAQVPFIAMHWRGRSSDMQEHADYGDVVADVAAELDHRMDSLVDAGIQFERILLDPGIGFAKNAADNWEILARLGELRTLGRPILVGASRKSFLGALLGTQDHPTPPRGRDAASAAISALAAASGAYCVRVHEVAATLDAVRVAAAWTASSSSRTSEAPAG